MLALDSTAILARYFDNPGQSLVLTAMAEDPDWCASAICKVEVILMLNQLGASRKQTEELIDTFRHDWESFYVVPVDELCLATAIEIGTSFQLSVIDALHLAAADRVPRPVTYVTLDQRQVTAAVSMGLALISPE